MVKRLRFAAVPLFASAAIAMSTASVWAFSQQTLGPNGTGTGNYNFNYSDPDNKAASGESTNRSDPNSPGFHFSIESGQTGPFGFRSLGGSSNSTAPDYWARPLGNGN